VIVLLKWIFALAIAEPGLPFLILKDAVPYPPHLAFHSAGFGLAWFLCRITPATLKLPIRTSAVTNGKTSTQSVGFAAKSTGFIS
jgi:hypothetical protein